jgi:hypothetical protein
MSSFSFFHLFYIQSFTLLCNIYLFLFNITEECGNTSDCYIMYSAPYGSMRCVKGFCKRLKDAKVMKFLSCE